MARFVGPDFYDVDSLLTEDERQIRDHVRGWVEDRYLPLVEKAYEEAYFPAEVIPEVGADGVARRDAAREVRLRRREPRRLRAGDAGARARRLGPALVRLGAGFAGDVSDLRVRQRGAAHASGCRRWRAAR